MDFTIPNLTLTLAQNGDPAGINTALQIFFLLTILTLAPSLIIMVTSFTRIIIVLGFIRNALGTQQSPPTQVLISIALFLTFFIMAPVIGDINNNAVQPYRKGEISQQIAIEKGLAPIRAFMFKQTRKSDLLFFVKISNIKPKSKKDIPTHVLTVSFILSELKTAFQMGFILFIPFLIIDIAIASLLMTMGMMMLPPIMISLPFKILLFVMIDGWTLITSSLVLSYK